MAGDRSNYRSIYPGILYFSLSDALSFASNIKIDQQMINQAKSLELSVNQLIEQRRMFYINIAKDLELAKKTGLLKWEINTILSLCHKIMVECKQLPREIKTPIIDPFSVIDKELSLYPWFPGEAKTREEMWNLFTRGHGWFGIGQWEIASALYMDALAKGFSLNDSAMVESAVRFLIDDYIAYGDIQSAVDILNAFLDHIDLIETELFVTKQSLENIVFGLFLNNRDNEAIIWLKKIPEVCKSKINPNVNEWNISELLIDVCEFLKDYKRLTAIRKNINAIQVAINDL